MDVPVRTAVSISDFFLRARARSTLVVSRHAGISLIARLICSVFAAVLSVSHADASGASSPPPVAPPPAPPEHGRFLPPDGYTLAAKLRKVFREIEWKDSAAIHPARAPNPRSCGDRLKSPRPKKTPARSGLDGVPCLEPTDRRVIDVVAQRDARPCCFLPALQLLLRGSGRRCSLHCSDPSSTSVEGASSGGLSGRQNLRGIGGRSRSIDHLNLGNNISFRLGLRVKPADRSTADCHAGKHCDCQAYVSIHRVSPLNCDCPDCGRQKVTRPSI